MISVIGVKHESSWSSVNSLWQDTWSINWKIQAVPMDRLHVDSSFSVLLCPALWPERFTTLNTRHIQSSTPWGVLHWGEITLSHRCPVEPVQLTTNTLEQAGNSSPPPIFLVFLVSAVYLAFCSWDHTSLHPMEPLPLRCRPPASCRFTVTVHMSVNNYMKWHYG